MLPRQTNNTRTIGMNSTSCTLTSTRVPERPSLRAPSSTALDVSRGPGLGEVVLPRGRFFYPVVLIVEHLLVIYEQLRGKMQVLDELLRGGLRTWRPWSISETT